MLLHKLYINVVIAHIFLCRPALKNLRRLRYKQLAEKKMKKQWYFSQNQKGFGCIGAAVLLILSPKELIWQKTRQSTLAITATILLKILTAENGRNSGSDSQSWLPRFLSYQLFRRQNKQHCRANTTKSFLVLGKIYIYVSIYFVYSKLYIYWGWQEVTGENFKVA